MRPKKTEDLLNFFTLSKSSVFNFNQILMTLYSADSDVLSEELSSSVFAASSFP